MSNNFKHDSALEHIICNIHKFGVDNPKWIAKDLRLYQNGNLVAELDILAYNGEYTIIEYKCSYKMVKATMQLNHYSHVLKDCPKIGPKQKINKLFVYGDYKQVEVK